ncbi:MAG: hypothetical protein N3A38_16920, partial [Planctomycetota bacterium]|nr:hypothetical protein [Planctomycetota bacterium]
IETGGIPRKPGEPRPAYHALALVARKLGGFSDVRAVNAGAGVHAYRFEVGGRRVYVAWYDDGKRYLPGDAEPSAAVELDVPSGPYVIVETPTKQGEMPRERATRADGSRLKLTLGSTPLFFEPARGGD